VTGLACTQQRVCATPSLDVCMSLQRREPGAKKGKRSMELCFGLSPEFRTHVLCAVSCLEVPGGY
jgi:hypothetical protein